MPQGSVPTGSRAGGCMHYRHVPISLEIQTASFLKGNYKIPSHNFGSPLPTVIPPLTMPKRQSLRCYRNNFCNPESPKSAMIKLPLETLSHLHVSLSSGSHLGNSFQLPCAPEPQICHAEGEKRSAPNKTLGRAGAARCPDFQGATFFTSR